MVAPLAASPVNFYYDYFADDRIQWSTDDREWMNYLPKGMRFRPTDQELIGSYLKFRVLGHPLPATGMIHEVNIYHHARQALKDIAYVHDDGRMYFFNPLKRKYNSKRKSERLVDGGRLGFWKATQKGAVILDKNGAIIGTKASLTYNTSTINKDTGKKKVKKEDWLMAEFRLPEKFYQNHNVLNKRKIIESIWNRTFSSSQ